MNKIVTLWQQVGAIWSSFLNGNDEAFSDLYCFSFDELMHFGHRLGASEKMTEDCIQDVFLKIYQKRDSFDVHVQVRAFLYAAVRNTVLNQMMRQKKTISLFAEESVFDLDYTIDEQLFKGSDGQLTQEIEIILNTLSPRQKEIVYLRFVHEMSYEEICEIMNLNVQSARNLLNRSMEKLRKTPYPYFLSHIVFVI